MNRIDNTKSMLKGLSVLQKDLENEQAAKELYDAISNARYEEAINILKNKPNMHINSGFGEYNQTALMKCCEKGDKSINVVKQLLKHPKLGITIKNNAGANCLHYACYYATPEITKLLLTRGDINSILNAKGNRGSTPLDGNFYRINGDSGKIEDINIWNIMVAKGAQLSYFKQYYEKLDSKNFKQPYNINVDIIKSNPPR